MVGHTFGSVGKVWWETPPTSPSRQELTTRLSQQSTLTADVQEQRGASCFTTRLKQPMASLTSYHDSLGRPLASCVCLLGILCVLRGSFGVPYNVLRGS